MESNGEVKAWWHAHLLQDATFQANSTEVDEEDYISTCEQSLLYLESFQKGTSAEKRQIRCKRSPGKANPTQPIGPVRREEA